MNKRAAGMGMEIKSPSGATIAKPPVLEHGSPQIHMPIMKKEIHSDENGV